MNGHRLYTFKQHVFVYGVHIVLLLGKDQHGRLRLLQALENVDHLRFLFDIFDILPAVEAGSSGTTHVHRNRLYQGTPRKVLNFLGHGSREEQRLTLALQQ